MSNTRYVAGWNTLSTTVFPAFYYAFVAYKSSVAAPTNSSGWFLPSIGQWWDAMEQAVLKNGITSFGLTDKHTDSAQSYFNITDKTISYNALNKLMSNYNNLVYTVLNTVRYWSSSEYDAANGCRVYFNDDDTLIGLNGKQYTYNARPFLAF